MAPHLGLAAVAFVSPQNHPILVRSFSPKHDDLLKYHYIAHTSLDVIDERSACPFLFLAAEALNGHDPSRCCTQVGRVLPRLPLLHGGRRRIRLHDSAEG